MEIDKTVDAIRAEIKRGIDELTHADLRSMDDRGARIYLLTDDDGAPLFRLSIGDPNDGMYHASTDQVAGPKAYSGQGCWQDCPNEPEEIRRLLHECLPDDLIEPYLAAVEAWDDQ